MFIATIYTPLDIRKWFYYNFAGKRFHTKNFIAELVRFKSIFIHKNDKVLFEPSHPLGSYG